MQFAVELWANERVNVEVVAVDGDIVVQLDGVNLDPRIVEWAIAYGFRQGIRDAGAALKNDAERNAAAWKRIDALKTNTLREGGGGGSRLPPMEREMRAIAEAKVRAAAMAQGIQLPAKKIADLAKKLYARDEAKIRAEAEANLASRAESVDFDLSDLDAA